ncbi:hypothetical protein ACHAW5_006227 [Stephanodiscus triporus]|uniref:Uncharacterized protein n=1 Tax=Stephanodiscus triporus TaxID=2934178 RepID=A0ABD3NLV0_9STRA
MYSFLFSVLSDCRGDVTSSRQALLEVGDHCYSGEVDLDFQQVTLNDIPKLVRTVQSQQDKMAYLCKASNIPHSSCFRGPIKELEKARDFVIAEITSDSIASHMTKLKEKHPWIDSLDKREGYFELVGNVASLFPNVLFVASRVYGAGGLVIDTIYFQGVIYVTLEECSGDQPLFDINFPRISESGSGATLAVYDDDRSGSGPWMKLSVWQSRSGQEHEPKKQSTLTNEPSVKNLSSDRYVQSYVILKSKSQDEMRKVLFRFGSWCYGGRVKLVKKIAMADVPYVMPAVRLQQRKLTLLSDIDSLSSCSPFAPALDYATKIQSLMEGQASGSEIYLRNLMENGNEWLEVGDNESFFEFACFDDGNSPLHNVEMIATKTYTSSGVITVSIYYGGNWYLVLNEGDDFPLVDTQFPSISRVGASGYNIRYYPNGITGWSQLRIVTIWHTHKEVDTGDENGCDSAETERADGIYSGDFAWDMNGMPVQKYEDIDACIAADDVVSHIGGDIYEQLDQHEISILEESLDKIGPDDSPGDIAWDIDGEKPVQNDKATATCLAAHTVLPQKCLINSTEDWTRSCKH